MINKMPRRIVVEYDGWDDDEAYYLDFPDLTEGLELSFFRNQRGQIEVSFRETRTALPETSA
jgi:hypothetical protein